MEDMLLTLLQANMSDSIMTQLQNKPSVTVRAKVRECRKICKELAQVNEAWVRARRGADGTQQQALELE